MRIQKVFQAGNSCVVVIPSELQKETGIRIGTRVSVEKKAANEIIIRKISGKNKKAIPPNLKGWWREFLKENSKILDELVMR